MSDIQFVKEVKVGLNFDGNIIAVGRLAIRDRTIYFEYDSAFLERNLEISPFNLPLQRGVSSFDYDLFEGLPGVFNDSLPDGWGRLLFDRFARSQGGLPADLTPLDRLAHVGRYGMGALVYEPDHSTQKTEGVLSLDHLAARSREVLAGEADDVLQELIALNGSSAGARPKAMIGVDQERSRIIHGSDALLSGYQSWIAKFPNSQDGLDAGAIEYVYALMAKAAGLVMPETNLFDAQEGAGYFAVRRFDREGTHRTHMHTACGLLHSDYRTPSLDYTDLIALTSMLTRDIRETEKMFRLAVFNVFAHNRDDHAKNFTFLMDQSGQWTLSPAYDLTFSSGPGGEQSTTVTGEGRQPATAHLKALGKEAGLEKKRVDEIIMQTKDSLSSWRSLAEEYGVARSNINLIAEKIEAVE